MPCESQERWPPPWAPEPSGRHTPLPCVAERLHSHPESANNGVSTLVMGVTEMGRMPRGWVRSDMKLGRPVPSVAGVMRSTTNVSCGRNHPNGQDHCF